MDIAIVNGLRLAAFERFKQIVSTNDIAHVYSEGKILKIMKYAQDTWCDKDTMQLTNEGKTNVKKFIRWLFRMDGNAYVQPGSWKLGSDQIKFTGKK